MALVLTTGEENASQEMSVPVPGRASPLRVRPTPGNELPLEPLSTVLYADAATTTPLAAQNGSIATPFSLAQLAINEVPASFGGGRTIILTPGDYGSGNAVVEKSITFIGLAQPGSLDQPTFGTIVLDAASAYFQNMAVAFAGTNSPTIELLNCQAGGDGGGGLVVARETLFTGPVTDTADFRAFDCNVNILTADVATLDECDVSGDITVIGTLTIRNVRTVQPGLTLTASSIVVDEDTLRALVFAGTTFVGTVSGFAGTVFTWGAAVAATGEFLDLGTRATPASFASEDAVRFFVGRRGVLCRLRGFAPSTTVLTARKSAADTALTITPNGAEALNENTFIEFGVSDTLDMAVGGAAGVAAICTAVFV